MAKSIINKVEAEIEVAEAKVESKKKVMSKIKYIFVALILLAEAVTLGVQVYNRYVPNGEYKEAVALYEQGDKKGALLKFEKLGDLKNSEYYCNLIYSENPLYRFDHCVVGDEIKFGKYNFEDIAWNVIEINENKVVLLSKYIIEAGSFPDETWMPNFSKKAFSESENMFIEKTCLLDDEMFTNLVKGKSYGKTEPTAKVLENKEYEKDEENGYIWWIDSTTSYSSGKHQCIMQSGAYNTGIQDDDDVNGIRPAITIKLK